MQTASEKAEFQLPQRQVENPNVAVKLTDEEKQRDARMILNAIKKEITAEKLPRSIESLVKAYNSVQQCEQAFLPEAITNNILMLKNIVDVKLLKLQEGNTTLGRLKNLSNLLPENFKNFLSPSVLQGIVPNFQNSLNSSEGSHSQAQLSPSVLQGIVPNFQMSQNSSELSHSQTQGGVISAWPTRIAAAAVSILSTTQPSSENHHELENGERVSEVVNLSRSLNYQLESEISKFKEAVRSADNFDRVCYSSFGFSLYSDEFGSFCSFMATEPARDDSELLERILHPVRSSAKKEHMREMSRDPGLRDLFKRLQQCTSKDHFYKIIALVSVNDIFASIPPNYKQSCCTELFLESLQLACHIFLQTQLSDGSSSNKIIREGIGNLIKKLYLIKVCSP